MQTEKQLKRFHGKNTENYRCPKSTILYVGYMTLKSPSEKGATGFGFHYNS